MTALLADFLRSKKASDDRERESGRESTDDDQPPAKRMRHKKVPEKHSRSLDLEGQVRLNVNTSRAMSCIIAECLLSPVPLSFR